MELDQEAVKRVASAIPFSWDDEAAGPNRGHHQQRHMEKVALDLLRQLARTLASAVSSSSTCERTISAEDVAAQRASLGKEQARVYDRVVEGRESLFVSGIPGSGKTHLLRVIVSGLRLSLASEVPADDDDDDDDSEAKEVAPTDGLSLLALAAPTGVAASHTGGTTLHALLGLSPKMTDETPARMITYIVKRDKTMASLRSRRVLLLDEVSMISRDMWEVLDQALRRSHEVRSKPFGGVQVVVFGDFFQLPPVVKSRAPPVPGTKDHPKQHPNQKKHKSAAVVSSSTASTAAPYCFRHESWRALFRASSSAFLSESFRQKDPTFVAELNRWRLGAPTPADVKKMRDRCARTVMERTRLERYGTDAEKEADAQIIRIFPFVAAVRDWNEQRFEALSTPTVHALARATLRPFTKKQELRIQYERRQWSKRAERQRYWTAAEFDVLAARIHALHQTKEEALVKLMNDMRIEHRLALRVGARVMLTRNIDVPRGLVHGCCGRLVDISEDGTMASVQFDRIADSHVEVRPVGISADCRDGTLTLNQMPLALAWAITVHKSQGMSFDRAVLDLHRLFASGQGYVALSRLTSFDGLQLIGFDASQIYADPHVLSFYRALFPQHFSTAADEAGGSSTGTSQSKLDRLMRAAGLPVAPPQKEKNIISTVKRTLPVCASATHVGTKQVRPLSTAQYGTGAKRIQLATSSSSSSSSSSSTGKRARTLEEDGNGVTKRIRLQTSSSSSSAATGKRARTLEEDGNGLTKRIRLGPVCAAIERALQKLPCVSS